MPWAADAPAVARMVDSDAYCPDVMKQLSAVQGSLERASRLVLRRLRADLGERR